MTQQSFADAIGVSKATVISWEARKSAIPVPSAKRIADYFNVDYFDFCDVDLESADKISVDELKLTDREKRDLWMFRQLPESSRAAIRAAVEAVYECIVMEQATRNGIETEEK